MLSEKISLELKDSTTLKNLVELFAKEAQTLMRYRRFASTAKYEAFPKIAELFERLAQNQTVLVDGHLDFLRTVNDPLSGLPLGQTSDNLNAALASEDALRRLYPLAAGTAEREGFVDIASWLRSTAASKKVHCERISAAIRESSETREP